MTEPVSLEFLTRTLANIQAEQRPIRDENKLIRSAISELATVLLARIGNFEAYVDVRLGAMDAKLDRVLQTVTSAESKG